MNTGTRVKSLGSTANHNHDAVAWTLLQNVIAGFTRNVADSEKKQQVAKKGNAEVGGQSQQTKIDSRKFFGKAHSLSRKASESAH
jgi:hypothetical protein